MTSPPKLDYSGLNGGPEKMMKRLLALAFALTLLSPILRSQTAEVTPATTGTVESQITDLEKQGVIASQSNDPKFIQSYLADDYMGIGSMGQMTDRQTAIDNLKTGKNKYDKLEILDRKITQYGPNAAIARGKVMIKGMYNGQPIDGAYVFSRTWLQRDGKWQVIGFQSTKMQ